MTKSARLRWLAPLALVAGIWAGQASAQSTVTVTTTPTPSFSPADVTITMGDSVMWTDLMLSFHTVSETDCPATAASVYNGGFRSGDPGAVDTYTETFNAAGEFCYLCESHVALSMFGSVTVGSPPIPQPIPTLSGRQLIFLALLLTVPAVWLVKRRYSAAS